jgi:surfeit locus 1 family protein
MWEMARRPMWIAALVLALGVAAGFAALGQWQLERSIASATVVERNTEDVRALERVAAPQSPVTEAVNGLMVEVTGEFVPGDYTVLGDRLNDSTGGFWVVGHFQAEVSGAAPAAVAVALGWAPTLERAEAVATTLDDESTSVVGRYLAPEAIEDSNFQSGAVPDTLSIASLVNQWNDFSGSVYGGYIVSHATVAGLDVIDSPVPTSNASLNLLNLFYAIEWAVFAGFAVFMWYRLVRDAWERETELAAEVAGGETAETVDVN